MHPHREVERTARHRAAPKPETDSLFSAREMRQVIAPAILNARNKKEKQINGVLQPYRGWQPACPTCNRNDHRVTGFDHLGGEYRVRLECQTCHSKWDYMGSE